MGGVHVGGGKGEESSIKKERGIWATVEERGGGGLVVVVLGGAAQRHTLRLGREGVWKKHILGLGREGE